jgi:carbon-monoxide dehydrogenase large subunit
VGGSRSAVIYNGAAVEAAVEVRAKVVEIAAHLLEVSADDLVIEHGVVSVRGNPTSKLSLVEIARTAYATPDKLPAGMAAGLEAAARFRPGAPITWANAAHACVVEVDPLTGAVEVQRFVVSEDCGKMVNPNVVEGQIAGGVVQGIGGVLLEHFVYDGDGNPLTTTFLDYLIPTATEVPTIEYGHIETPAPTNPGGFKGLGEGGAIGAPPAVFNAVMDALAHLGVSTADQPLGPAQVVELLERAGR